MHSLFFFAILRFGEGIRRAEAERRERDERARQEAAERLKRPFADADINTIKDLIKAKTGKRPRFNGREQLLDILEYANSADDVDSGDLSTFCFVVKMKNKEKILINKMTLQLNWR